MNKMDEITRRLASHQPMLDDADALCDSIMNSLPPQSKSHGMTLLGVLRWTSSIAAVCLLFLFVKQSHTIGQPQEDADYERSLQAIRSEYVHPSNNLSPDETLRLYVDAKRQRTSIAAIKKHLAL